MQERYLLSFSEENQTRTHPSQSAIGWDWWTLDRGSELGSSILLQKIQMATPNFCRLITRSEHWGDDANEGCKTEEGWSCTSDGECTCSPAVNWSSGSLTNSDCSNNIVNGVSDENCQSISSGKRKNFGSVGRCVSKVVVSTYVALDSCCNCGGCCSSYIISNSTVTPWLSKTSAISSSSKGWTANNFRSPSDGCTCLNSSSCVVLYSWCGVCVRAENSFWYLSNCSCTLSSNLSTNSDGGWNILCCENIEINTDVISKCANCTTTNFRFISN